MKHPVSPLRERRRKLTAREIQHAALELVRAQGFAPVTTEMIAEAAGVSQRTFFNYYPNKEAALLGPPVQIDAASIAAFAAARGPLVDDFGALILAQFEANAASKSTIRAIGDVVRMVPELGPAFSNSLVTLKNQLAPALVARGGAPDIGTEILAEVLAKAMAYLFHGWAHDAEQTPEAAIAAIAAHLRSVAVLLMAGDGGCTGT